jgi:hypothetical protein
MARVTTRMRMETLLVGLASGRKMEEILQEMKLSLKQARRSLRGKVGRKVLEEVREMRMLQRELTNRKEAVPEAAREEGVVGVGELPEGVTEEEVREEMRRNAEL